MRSLIWIRHSIYSQWRWFILLFIIASLRAQVFKYNNTKKDIDKLLSKGHERVLKFTEKDRLLYKGYEIERFQDSKSGLWVATLKKEGKGIATFDRDGYEKEMTQFGLFPCLGNKEAQQLIIEQYSGGVHCCWSDWIIVLYPEFRVIYDSDKYGIGYPLDFIDLDGDGVFEFITNISTFDYFDILPHSLSPFPTCIFKYGRNVKEYFPASHIFPAYILEGIEETIKEVEKLAQKVDSTNYANEEKLSKYLEYLTVVLNVVTTYIYAGKEEEAWIFYDKEYKLPNKGEMKSKIRKRLKECPIYKCIYKR